MPPFFAMVAGPVVVIHLQSESQMRPLASRRLLRFPLWAISGRNAPWAKACFVHRWHKYGFNAEQEAVLAPFLLEFWQEHRGRSDETTWKRTTVDSLLEDPAFKDKLPSEAEDAKNGACAATWTQRLKDKFKNYKPKQQKADSNPNATGGASTAAKAKVGVTPSSSTTRTRFFGRPTLSASRLFEIENKEVINKAAAAEATAKGSRRSIGHFQPCKKKMWEGLSDDAQAKYKNRAEELQNDVKSNQDGFNTAIWDDMDTFVRSGAFGSEFTMTLMWGMRDPQDRMVRGRASVHSVNNRPYFEESEGGDQVWELYKSYTEIALPARVSTALDTEYHIPLNADGIPVFPDINLMNTAPAAVASALKQFIRRVWEHCRPSQPSFSWDEAAVQYDKARFPVPVAFENRESLSVAQAFSLADFFLKLQEEDAFVFKPEGDRGGEEVDGGNKSGEQVDGGYKSGEEVDGGNKSGEEEGGSRPKPTKKSVKDKGKQKQQVEGGKNGGETEGGGGVKPREGHEVGGALDNEDTAPKTPKNDKKRKRTEDSTKNDALDNEDGRLNIPKNKKQKRKDEAAENGTSDNKDAAGDDDAADDNLTGEDAADADAPPPPRRGRPAKRGGKGAQVRKVTNTRPKSAGNAPTRKNARVAEVAGEPEVTGRPKRTVKVPVRVPEIVGKQVPVKAKAKKLKRRYKCNDICAVFSWVVVDLAELAGYGFVASTRRKLRYHVLGLSMYN
ncbi:hypothetical protein C8R44DRAFT_855012 [Mycena epipterygia]|nr:hypothetical protein C8R44DRAFT_855012 [Mycena epipterygia]